MKALWLTLALAASAVTLSSPAMAARPPNGIPPHHIHGIIIHHHCLHRWSCHHINGLVIHHQPNGLAVNHGQFVNGRPVEHGNPGLVNGIPAQHNQEPR